MKKSLLISISLCAFLFSSCAALFNNTTNKDDKKTSWLLGAAAGVPMGDASDFYSFTYSGSFGYEIKLGDSPFYAGAETGYTRFTGKDTDMGFETDGIGFIPVKAKIGYNISESIGLEGGVGYGISADGGEGGSLWNVGLNWYPVSGLRLSAGYNSFDVDFDSFGIGISRSF
ncbi:hypothetical protein [Flagellimonas sp.]|uniref:hypothetical protein n=1 Tax=Flagellimonas sp. TaxID=2058762 RepID=UPI003B50759F